MDANIWKILVTEGDIVEAGRTVIVLAAMKMEISVCIPLTMGRVKVEKIMVVAGTTVQVGAKLLYVRQM